MNALELAQAETDKEQHLRDLHRAQIDANRREEERKRPVLEAWSKIMPSIPDRRCIEYRPYAWLIWAKQTADRISEFIEVVAAAGYSDRLDFMAEVSDPDPNYSRSWLYVLIAKQFGIDALHRLIIDSVPQYSEPIRPCWWPAFKGDFPSEVFFSRLTAKDLPCPACGQSRTAQAAKDDRPCDECRSTDGTMSQLVDAWDMLELYKVNSPSLHTSGAHDTILAAAAVVLEECKRTPELLQLHKSTARRAIVLMAKRLNIGVNEAFKRPFLEAKVLFENWMGTASSQVMANDDGSIRNRDQFQSKPAHFAELGYLGCRIDDKNRRLTRDGYPDFDETFHHRPQQWPVIVKLIEAGETGLSKDAAMNIDEKDGAAWSSLKKAIRSSLSPIDLDIPGNGWPWILKNRKRDSF